MLRNKMKKETFQKNKNAAVVELVDTPDLCEASVKSPE